MKTPTAIDRRPAFLALGRRLYASIGGSSHEEMNACASEGRSFFFHRSSFHFDKAGPVENRVEYRIQEASGGSVNAFVICCNGKNAIPEASGGLVNVAVSIAYRRPPAALSMFF